MSISPTLLRCLSVLLLLTCCHAWGQSTIVIKFSHVVANDTPKGKAALRFKALAEAATKGRVRVEVYPNSSLYKDKEELEALQLGAVQMLAPSLAKFAPLGIKEFEVFDVPYIFPDKATLYRVTQGPVGQNLLQKLETKGIVGLAFWDNGFKQMSSNKPIRVPSDMHGQKMRIQPSKVIDLQMRALGAVPMSLAFSEVFQALKTGLVDGTENPISNLYTQHMHEVQKYLTLTNHAYLGYAVIVNKKFWDDLPGDIRDELETAMKSATIYANTIAEQENEAALAAVRRSGKTVVVSLSAKDLAAWKTALLPVQKNMAGRISADLIARVNLEAALAEKK